MTEPASVLAPSAFPSLASLRAAHNDLLKRHRDAKDDPALLPEIDTFLQRGRESGAFIDSDADRQNAQSILDYWVTILYRANHRSPDAILVDFDPNLAPEIDSSQCPYLGLSPFQSADHDVFFGRERLVEDILARLQRERVMAIFGASGSGKSSLVLAGLLPALQRGGLPGSEDWLYYAPMVPGSNPLRNLAQITSPPGASLPDWIAAETANLTDNPQRLAELAGAQNAVAVLVIDQFEELFTLCTDESLRQAFVAKLLNFAGAGSRQNVVLLTMRSDFESQVVLIPQLTPYFERAIHVTPLSAVELRLAIEKPAARVGLKFEDGIVDEVVKEVLGQAAGLPLLQFTLLKLWQKRERNRVTWAAYRPLGNVRLALGRSADALYESLVPEDQVIVRRILMRLVRPSEGLEVTSNRVRVATLAGLGAEDRVNRVLKRLIEERLLRLTKGETPQDNQVEVAHEALVRNWPLLVEWLERERVNLRTRLRLTAAAELWQAHGRDPGGLIGGSLLTEAAGYDDLNELEKEFVASSEFAIEQAAREREAARQREVDLERQNAARQQRINRRLWVSAVAVAFACLASWLAIRALKLNRISSDLRFGSEAGQLKARQLDNEAAMLSLFSYRRVWNRDPAFHGRLDEYIRNALGTRFNDVIHKGTWRINSVALDRDGKTAAFADENGGIWLLRDLFGVAEQIHIQIPKSASQNIAAVSLASDGRSQAIVWLRADEIGLRRFGADSTQEYRLPPRPKDSPAFVTLAASPTEPLIALATEDGSVQLWNWTSHSPPVSLLSSAKNVVSLDFSQDGSRLAAGSYDKTVQIWSVGDQKTLALLKVPDRVNSVALSRDGKFVAAAFQESGVSVWDLNKPAVPCGSFLPGESVLSVKLPSCEMVVAGLADGTVRLNDGDMFRVASKSDGSVNSVAAIPGGTLILSGSTDGTVRVSRRIDEPVPIAIQPGAVLAAGFNPGARLLAAANDDVADTSVNLFALPASGIRLLRHFQGHRKKVQDLIFDRDGVSVISGDVDGTILRWDRSNAPAQALFDQRSEITSLAIAVDSSLLASTGRDNNIHLWDRSSHGCATSVQLKAPVLHAVLSRNGRWLAGGDVAGRVRLWDLSRCSAPVPVDLTEAQHTGPISNLAFSPDYGMLASGSADGEVRLWTLSHKDRRPYKFGTGAAPGAENRVTALAFSSPETGAHLLAAGYQNGAVRAWDTDYPEGAPFIWDRHTYSIKAIGFTRDAGGPSAFSIDNRQTLLRWTDTPDLAKRACSYAHNLTSDEWTSLLMGGPPPAESVCK